MSESRARSRVRRAAIYREAARRIHDRDYGWFSNTCDCPDIAIGTTDKDYKRDPEREAFRQALDTNIGDFRGNREASMFALCLMAAMVEAGDA